jgi:hypothetical protein
MMRYVLASYCSLHALLQEDGIEELTGAGSAQRATRGGWRRSARGGLAGAATRRPASRRAAAGAGRCTGGGTPRCGPRRRGRRPRPPLAPGSPRAPAPRSRPAGTGTAARWCAAPAPCTSAPTRRPPPHRTTPTPPASARGTAGTAAPPAIVVDTEQCQSQSLTTSLIRDSGVTGQGLLLAYSC